MRWQIVIPQKPLKKAKSRLGFDGPSVPEAMLRDVLTACRGPELAVAILGNDPLLHAFKVPLLHDAGGGLSAAVRVAVAAISGPVAVLMADLPCLDAEELARVLSSAEEVAFGAVADAAGTGTTLLTARRGVDLQPSYGVGSFGRHLDLGAVDLLAGRRAAPGLQRDVDTFADLLAAREMGVGAATLAATLQLG